MVLAIEWMLVPYSIQKKKKKQNKNSRFSFLYVSSVLKITFQVYSCPFTEESITNMNVSENLYLMLKIMSYEDNFLVQHPSLSLFI